MKTILETRRVTIYRSEIHASIQTEDEALGQTIAWADDNAVSYDIVRSSKSKTFGLGSREYFGWAQRSTTPEAVIERLDFFLGYVIGRHAVNSPESPGEDFMHWRAMFTLEHFNDPGFTGGFFQQHARWTDGFVYPRACIMLDYTPATFEEVLDRFCTWMNRPPVRYENSVYVTVDGVDKRRFDTSVDPQKQKQKRRA